MSRYNDDRRTHRRDEYNRGEDYRDREAVVPRGERPVIVKEKPNFKPSGLLAKDSNNVQGTQLKYTECDDSSLPDEHYTLFIFSENSKVTREFGLHNKSHFLLGRDAKVVDILTDDESISKQHAVVQFRKRNIKGEVKVLPYIIDLESSNGTFINGEEIPPSRFVELKPEDVLRFGESTTDYVLMKSSD